MMKKSGFTLAEVLITLAIIGVVATLTLPSLMSNTAEQQSITAFKKIMNTLNEAGQMNSALEGFDYSVATMGGLDDHVENGDQTLGALLNERLQVSRNASGGYGNSGECTGDETFVLRDGTAICLVEAHDDSGFWRIYVDTNGPKGPNLLSTCGEEGCTTKSERLIKDQFPVTICRGIAIPGHWTDYEVEGTSGGDYAARYAMGIGRRADSN